MDIRYILVLFAFIYLVAISYCLPVSPKKDNNIGEHNERDNDVEKKIESEMDDLGLEYGRYLQQVVEALEQDKEFAKKLENVSQDEIKNGAIARELNFVSHGVRTRLDELKRVEMDRLRKLARKEHELEENGGIYDQMGDDGRRWRTLGGDGNNKLNNALDDKNAGHLDHQNPHSFEAEDLQKLILAATKDLEELDKKRREDFKQYEMEKELQYRESLNNMTEEQKVEAKKKHEDLERKHKDHPRVHHPGSKQQLEQVWEEMDHMPKEEFNPKVFFTMHDVNGDGFLDPQEVEAILTLEIKKVYSDKNPEDDPNEMMEEYHRMREHIYREADLNRDGLISKKEFLDFTHRMEFERDDGWKGLDETQVYNEEDLKQYQQNRQHLQQQYGQYGAYQAQYVPQYYPEGYHPQQPVYAHPGQQMHPNQVYYQPVVQHPNPQLHPQQQQHLTQEQHQQLQQQALYHQQQQQALLHAQQQQQYANQQPIHQQIPQQMPHMGQQQQAFQQAGQQINAMPVQHPNQQLGQGVNQQLGAGHQQQQQQQQHQVPQNLNVGQQLPPNQAMPSNNHGIPPQVPQAGQQLHPNQVNPNLPKH